MFATLALVFCKPVPYKNMFFSQENFWYIFPYHVMLMAMCFILWVINRFLAHLPLLNFAKGPGRPNDDFGNNDSTRLHGIPVCPSILLVL